MTHELHVAGIIVHAHPASVQRVADALCALPGAAVHATSADGKLVVALEGGSAREIAARMDDIQQLDTVMSASLMYQDNESIEVIRDFRRRRRDTAGGLQIARRCVPPRSERCHSRQGSIPKCAATKSMRLYQQQEKVMSIRKSIVNAAVVGLLAGAVSLPYAAAAQPVQPRHTADEIAKAKPTATFDLTSQQLRLIVGGGTANGTLHFKGKNYPFKAKGVTAGGVGYTKSTATGDVYFLEKVEDFAGTYSAVTIGATVGAGAGGSQYENQKGVFVKVRSKTEGVSLNLGLGAVTVEFVK